MKRKLFELHAHYLFKMSKEEMVDIFKEEFEHLNIKKVAFMSIPQEYSAKGEFILKENQNKIGLYLKEKFAPNAYAFAGLEHPRNYDDIDSIKADFLKQVKEYFSSGFDGMKMLEGYPTFIKYTKQGLDSPIYDDFYKFCEENRFPILLHLANPDESWDTSKASKFAIEQGRVYDESYPSKDEITSQMFNILKKFPNLTLVLAHFGFFSKHYEDAIKFMSYPNTYLDTTPGGEQFINISKNYDLWKDFFVKYQDRILYGSDLYNFPKNDDFEIAFNRRPSFLKKYFETDTTHIYLDEEFKGIKLDEKILEKIYYKNALKLLKNPK